MNDSFKSDGAPTKEMPKYVKGKRLLELLFEDPETRPSERWLANQQKSRTLPFCRIGRLIFWQVDAVRAAMEEKLTVKPRR